MKETRSDVAVLEDAYSASAPDIYRVVRAIVGDPRTAEDVTQETFIKAQQALDRYDRTRPIRPWLTTIAIHLAVDHQRRERLRHVIERGLRASGLRRSHAELVDLRIDLDAALRGLTPRERAVVVSRYYAGLSYQEIATALAISPENVGTTLHRAHAHLRLVLTPTASGEGDEPLVTDRQEAIR